MAQLGVIWADGIWNTAIWDTAIWEQSGAPDVTAPTLSSATVATNGASITLAFSENVSVGAGGNGGFALTQTNGGLAVTLTYASGSGTSSLVYNTSRTITRGETLTLAYTQPGSGIEDAAGNDLASFSGSAVTNNSTQNNAPTDISINKNYVYTNSGVNAIVGTLSTTDDPGESFTYSLVAGTGSTNNASFNISGANLRCNDPSALGAGNYSVRVQSSDGVATYAEAIAIQVRSPTAAGQMVRDAAGDMVRDMVSDIS